MSYWNAGKIAALLIPWWVLTIPAACPSVGPAWGGWEEGAWKGTSLGGNADELAFQIDLQPKRSRMVTISYGDPSANLSKPYPERTHAKFTKHFDGLGWESEMTAWRVYFDKRNAIDLFGKRKHGLYLERFGQPDYKYQDESPVGRDIYNVGDSAGIGAVGALADRRFIRVSDVADRSWRIVSSGPLRTIVELTYKQWKVGNQSLDLTSRITQWAGERGFEHRVTISRGVGTTLVAALPRGPGFETSSRGGSYAMSTWGPQVVKAGPRQTESLPDQNLGLAVLVPRSSVMRCAIDTDPSNYLAQLSVKNGTAAWYALAAWDQEEKGSGAKVLHPAPVTTAGDFTQFVKAQSMRLAMPATVTLSSSQPEKQMF